MSKSISDLIEKYQKIRQQTEHLCEPLGIEDYVVQSMPDASPIKWHLAHTSWFFETLILAKYLQGYKPLDSQYEYLFNSYYNTIGEQYHRPQRSFITRPTVKEVYDYRKYVDDHMMELMQKEDAKIPTTIIEVGLNHEQQHQELILTDIKNLFSFNPLYPIYKESKTKQNESVPMLDWLSYSGGQIEIGSSNHKLFSYDNEMPRHPILLHSYQLANRLVTCGEYLAFMEDGGYKRAELWLSDGWDLVNKQGWQAPLYCFEQYGKCFQYTLSGLQEVNESDPVCHVSFFEADAYARWAGFRLPSEQEWENAAAPSKIEGNFVEAEIFHPVATNGQGEVAGPVQIYGDVWEWTKSSYAPYPGFKPLTGALGEYNGKFMCNQMVLRGGSCATPQSHMRPTYRNFFYPHQRWQFSGIRLARDV